MKPIGQYPSPAEYKSVGLTPPPRHVLKQALLASRAEVDDADLMTDTPITPIAEEDVTPSAFCIEEDAEKQSEMVDTTALEGSAAEGQGTGSDSIGESGSGDEPDLNGGMNTTLGVKAASALNGEVNGKLNGTVKRSLDRNLDRSLQTGYKSPMCEPVLDPLPDTPATPISNAVDPTAQRSSVSPAETPVGEMLSRATLASLTRPLNTPPVTAVVDNMHSRPKKVVNPDLLTVLDSIPIPASTTYNMVQMRIIVQNAVRDALREGERNVAVSLIHYWSRAIKDDFKLSLIFNLGCEETDHSLELALRTMLRSSVEDASAWLKKNHPPQLESDSDSSLSSMKSLDFRPRERTAFGRTTFKAADIYRDTSGPKLEEAFVSGKSNTAPLKRPKKPCPVNENPYKRHLDWNSDPNMAENLRNKRARFSEQIAVDPPQAQESSIRSVRKRPDEMDSSDAERVSAISTSLSASARVRRTSMERQVERIAWREKCVARAKEAQQKKRGKGRGRGRTRSKSAETPITKGWESAASDSCYSDRENEWDSRFDRRRSPSSIEPPENLDNCAVCDGGGELLCCDTCDYAFHFRCLRPAMDPKKPPAGDWSCPRCEAQIFFTRAIRRGEFGTRKTEYTPPQDIKDYFWGVGEVVERSSHIYQEVPHLPRLTKPAKQDTPTPFLNDPSLLKLSENGQLIYCAKCGKTSLQVRPMIRCDYCTSRWHLDCLDPPRTLPPSPCAPIGWMCPNHVRPSEMIVSKVVDGRVQQRRVRRPKNTVSDVDIDILTSDDPNETSFDDDWREKRFRLPAGDVVMQFVSAVHDNKRRREHEYFERIQETAVTVARQLTVEHFSNAPNTPSSQGLPTPLEQNITAAVQKMQSGDISSDLYDAASALLGLSQGQPDSAVVGKTSTQLSQPPSSDSKFDNLAAAEDSGSALPSPIGAEPAANASFPAAAAGPRPDDAVATGTPQPPTTTYRPSSNSPKPSTSTPQTSKFEKEVHPRTRASARKKRTRNESSASVDNEPAQKRRHTDSD